jgi:hypothetical protein
MSRTEPPLTLKAAISAGAANPPQPMAARVACVAIAVTLALIACRHAGQGPKPIPAATPHAAASVQAEFASDKVEPGNAQMPADEWQDCATSNAVCSATSLPAGAEAMDSAASPPRSVVTAKTGIAGFAGHAAGKASPASAQSLARLPPSDRGVIGNASMEHAGVAAHVAASQSSAALPAEHWQQPAPQPQSRQPHAAPTRQDSSPHDSRRSLIALATAAHDAGYWYAWLALAVLLLLVGWWFRRRSQLRGSATSPAAKTGIVAPRATHAEPTRLNPWLRHPFPCSA